MNPATESIQGSQWWTDYQVVSYKLQSKRGTSQQYKNMIDTCHSAGVKVIAGISPSTLVTFSVLTFVLQTSYSTIWPAPTPALVLQAPVRSHSVPNIFISSYLQSSAFTHYDYPGIYQGGDFHHCGTPGDDITDWNDRSQVQNCELANLAESVSLRNRPYFLKS